MVASDVNTRVSWVKGIWGFSELSLQLNGSLKIFQNKTIITKGGIICGKGRETTRGRG